MTQREPFEDIETIERYIRAIPEPDSSYQQRLYTQLTAAPSRRRLWPVRLRWPWTAGFSGMLAVAAALALLLVPFGPHHDTPLNPRAVLAQAVSAEANPTPYRGTSEITFVAGVDDAPGVATTDLGTHRIVSSWEVQDMTHWRVDVHVLQPTLQSETMIAVANGASAVLYRGNTNHAVRFRLSPSFMGLALLSEFQGSGGMALAQTLQQYLRELNNPKMHTHARAIGQKQVLGRTADGIEIWPVVRSSTGSCTTAAQCARNEKGYGRAIIWIDHEHGLVLRYEQLDIPARQSPMHGFVYRVTSLTVGNGPTAPELAYRSPVKPVLSTSLVGGSSGSGSTGGGPGYGRWIVPRGFIHVGTPHDVQGHAYVLFGIGSSADTGVGTVSAYAQYRLGWNFTDPSTSPRAPFVYVQEQYRVTGLPQQLMGGQRHTVGACMIYTGVYPDGLHWLAFARGHITFLAVANQLTEIDLMQWITSSARSCG